MEVQAAVLEVRAEAAKAETALEAEVDVLRASQQEAAAAHAFAEQARQGFPPSIGAPQLICCRRAQQETIQSGVTTDNCDSGLQMCGFIDPWRCSLASGRGLVDLHRSERQ